MSRLKSAAGPAGAPSPSRLGDLGRVGRSAVSVARACRIALSIVDTPCENLYHAPEINKRSLCEGWARGRVFECRIAALASPLGLVFSRIAAHFSRVRTSFTGLGTIFVRVCGSWPMRNPVKDRAPLNGQAI